MLFLYKVVCRCLSFYYSFWGRLNCRFWGVQIGSKCLFRGDILIYRTPGSKISIGDRCRFNSINMFNHRGLNHKCILSTGTSNASISIGTNCGFSGVSIVSDCSIEIGNNVLVGANCSIGDRDGHSDRYFSLPKDIKIGNSVWLGMNVTVLKGVTIGENSIVGANSLVTKNIPKNEIWAGVPAVFIKKNGNEDK